MNIYILICIHIYIKETYKIDVQNRTNSSANTDLRQTSLMQKQDLCEKRPTKETYKRDLKKKYKTEQTTQTNKQDMCKHTTCADRDILSGPIKEITK